MPYVFDLDSLGGLAETGAEAFRNADPYPHAVFDGFLREAAVRELAGVFPKPEDRLSWDRFGAVG